MIRTCCDTDVAVFGHVCKRPLTTWPPRWWPAAIVALQAELGHHKYLLAQLARSLDALRASLGDYRGPAGRKASQAPDTGRHNHLQNAGPESPE